MPRIAWENDILGFVPRTDWLDVGTIVARPNDPVDQLIDDTKTDNLVAEWESLASEFQIPVMAQFHGFDTEAQTTFRVPIDRHNIEKADQGQDQPVRAYAHTASLWRPERRPV